jgi:uncharacterized UPF0160 family protein
MNWLINKISKKTVAVHSGNFHPDDIFSVAILSLHLNYIPKIIRTREEEKIKKADYAFDVGQEYDLVNRRFDHHQVGGAGKRDNGIPYASSGLVWREYGDNITESKEVQDYIDKKLIQVIDADDNAKEISQNIFPDVRPYTISDYIVYRNSSTSDKDKDGVFKKLVIWAMEILQMEIKIAKSILSDYKKVEATYAFSTNKKVIILDGDYAWEEKISEYPEPLFVIKPSVAIKSWKIYAVKDNMNKFKNRVNLPAVWGGKRDEELAKVTGVADAIYCHHALYMAIAGSKEGALKLAELALTEADKNNKK